MIGRPEIQRLAREGGVDERTQERDYVLTWLLAGMANQDMGLVFKGGTCLRRCYIRDYRYSEDLDFTLPEGAVRATAADAVSAWCQFIGEKAGIQADATADEALGASRAWVSFTGPLAARRARAIKVDMADDEEVIEAVVRRSLRLTGIWRSRRLLSLSARPAQRASTQWILVLALTPGREHLPGCGTTGCAIRSSKYPHSMRRGARSDGCCDRPDTRIREGPA